VRIDDLLRRNALQRADDVAIIDAERELTWSELDRETDKMANALLSRGYREQERVAVVLSNSASTPVVFFALWKCNLVSVAINPRLTGSEIERILEHSGVTAVICESEVAAAAAQAVQASHRRIRDVFSVRVLDDGSVPTLASVVAEASSLPVARRGGGDDLRSIRYTSGTTGVPKGCMATHSQQLASVANLLVELDIDRSGPMYLAVPLTLGVGAFYLTLCAYAGSPLLIRSKFTAASFRDDLERYDVRHAFLVPTMLVDLVEDLAQRPLVRDCSLDIVGYGGAAVGWEVVETVQKALGCRIYQCLGATELGGMATLFTPADHELMFAREKKPWPTTPIGRAAAYAQLRIVDGEGAPTTAGEVGEIQVRSASNFAGYWGQPEETRAIMRRGGWLALGDMGFTDEFGYVYLADRRQDVIRSGAQNVYAAEVEIVVQSHPSVARAGVVGTPDHRFGEAVKAYVQLVPGAAVSTEEIVDYCADRLAGYKRPRVVVFVDLLPVDEGGKVRRGALRTLGPAERDAV
jgi:acyl-CoA synthetase (AMP-forming)/AMP-acid ligase II